MSYTPMQPRVTFIVPCYNYGHYVAQAVDSLLEQTFQALEVIVINDASPDNTTQVLERYANDPRVRVVQHAENQRHIRSYNEGIGLARGEFVGIMSADDYSIRADAVARQVAIFDSQPDVGFVYSGYQFVDADGAAVWVKQPRPADYVRQGLSEFADLIFDNYVPHSGTLIRRTVHAALGVYDTRLPHAADWDMWLRISAQASVGYVAEPLYAYRIHARNMHHSSISPARETTEHVLTVSKAFDGLSDSAPASIRGLQQLAMRRAWLRSNAVECSAGRVRRAWQALVDATWREPALVISRPFYAALAKTLILTVLGQERYNRLAEGRRSIARAELAIV